MNAADALPTQPLPTDQGEGVLLVQSGGLVLSINPRARQAFHLLEAEQPDLERLARKTRPANAFLSLCDRGPDSGVKIKALLKIHISDQVPAHKEVERD